MHAVIGSKIQEYSGLVNDELLHKLQADTNYALAGASGPIRQRPDRQRQD
jgi:hypothetical protein